MTEDHLVQIDTLNEDQIKAALTDHQALACTMVHEAAGDWRQGNSSVEERIAVGCVLRNRCRQPKRWKPDYRGVALARWQFSCWNPNSGPNHERLMQLAYLLVTGQPVTDSIYLETAYLAQGIQAGTILDRVGGATFYYAPKAMVPAGSKPPWVFVNGKDGPEHPVAAAVGDQLFYRL